MSFEVTVARTEGLGDATYIGSHRGMGIVVDPQRDIDRFIRLIEDLDIEVRYVLETHLHNDYVSGARDLARVVGAELILPAGAAPVYRHTPAFHNEEFRLGDLTLRPMHTPGHTPEHVSYLITDSGVDRAVFSGGSLLVGSAGRSDLLGVERAETLARLQYGSVTRIARLSDETALYPTHGAGSFCTASIAGRDTSTIGEERRSNPVLRFDDEDEFASAHLSALKPYPDYYAEMGPANLAGRPPLDLEAALPRLSEQDHADLAPETVVVDVRSPDVFASGHLAGSLGIPARDDFGVWVGWVTDFNSPIVLVTDGHQDVDDLRRQLGRIGYDRVIGVIDGLAGWGEALVAYPTHDLGGFRRLLGEGAQFLDTRAPDEWLTGTIAEATTAYAPTLTEQVPEGLDREVPVFVACETGYRATIAASLLEARGYRPEVLLGAGVPELLAAGTG